MPKFEVELLDEAFKFIHKQDVKVRMKIFQNIERSQESNDPRLFKKINRSLWEFRTRYAGNQYRLLAFWDKMDKRNVLVLATHGFIKKTQRLNTNEIKRAEGIRIEYFKKREQ